MGLVFVIATHCFATIKLLKNRTLIQIFKHCFCGFLTLIHLAAAVAFDEDVRGDYLTVNGRKFVVCDPTYIEASVGMAMTGLGDGGVHAIVLR